MGRLLELEAEELGSDRVSELEGQKKRNSMRVEEGMQVVVGHGSTLRYCDAAIVALLALQALRWVK